MNKTVVVCSTIPLLFIVANGPQAQAGWGEELSKMVTDCKPSTPLLERMTIGLVAPTKPG